MSFVVNDDRPSDSPFANMIWRSRSGSGGSFISQATSRWEMVLTKHRGKTTMIVRGPETKATPADFPADAEWLDITFTLGTFMPHLPLSSLRDGCVMELPCTGSSSFRLYGSTWEIPTYDNADTFLMRLERAGLLVRDPLVDAVLQGYPQAMSPRAVQYHFLRATGLTQNKIHQIERANRAATLLASGMPIIDVTYEVGYFDQSHLANSLKRFIGQSPAEIFRVSQSDHLNR